MNINAKMTKKIELVCHFISRCFVETTRSPGIAIMNAVTIIEASKMLPGLKKMKTKNQNKNENLIRLSEI